MTKLSVTIITFNEEDNIGRTLESLKGLADEVLIVDSFSTDRTVEICESFGCRIIRRAFTGFVDQKQFAVDEAQNDWIFSLDADEELTEDLRNEMIALFAKDKIPHDGYNIRFSLSYLGRILNHSGVGFEHKLRLFNRQVSKFDFSLVHEVVKVNGSVGRLIGKSIHYSFRDLFHHLEKLNRYTSLAAEQNVLKGKKYPKYMVPVKFLVTFFIYYFIKRGFLDGFPGFIWCFTIAFDRSVRITKTVELQKKGRENKFPGISRG